MERKAITCPRSGHLEVIDYEPTPLGLIVLGCTRSSPGELRCTCECARRIDRRDRSTSVEDPGERVLVVYAGPRDPAETIARALRDDQLWVEIADVRLRGTPPPEDYDAVVFIAPATSPGGQRALDAYMAANLDGLSDRPTRTFSVPDTCSQRVIELRAIAFARLLADDLPAAQPPPA